MRIEMSRCLTTCLVAQIVKNPACNGGDPGSVSGSGGSPGEGNGYPLRYSCLGSPMDRDPGGLQYTGSQSWTRLNDYTLGFPGSSVGKESACNAGDLDSIPGSGRSPGVGKEEMTTHSSILAWRISWTEDPGGSMGSRELDTT